MKLILNTRGSHICKKGECFEITAESQKNIVSASKVEQIVITESVSLTSDMLKLAVENNIDVVFLQTNGKPFGRVWYSNFGSISTIRRKQLSLQTSSLGTSFVKAWIIDKLKSQTSHLSDLAMNRRDERRDLINNSIEQIRDRINKINALSVNTPIADIRNTIQGYEGGAAKIYFSAISDSLPEKYKFNGRSRNPANDEFNCMLNYCYGIFYSLVEKACIISGLDPYIGILHTDNYNRTALVFDLIERYRYIANRIVFNMFTTHKIKEDMFDKVENGYYLNKEGKIALIEAYTKEIEKKITRNKRKIDLESMIISDCHEIANIILKDVPDNAVLGNL